MLLEQFQALEVGSEQGLESHETYHTNRSRAYGRGIVKQQDLGK